MPGTPTPALVYAPTLIMSSPTAEEVIDAFVDILREQLEDGEAVEVPGLGTFSVEHRPSEVEESEGERQLVPPRNVVVFDPEQE
ncbi:MAG: hypothetical protein BRD39_02725 [Bacteroidetes bacterium QH_9_64_21]|nr:MAG: hypothetical protein BRD39_02725 [Bacteroidetes bacterium QH_9_64_21]